MRLFLDANVLFTAAHNPRGKAALVIELGVSGHWALCSSRLAVEEARRNLARKFPHCLDRPGTLARGVRLVEHRAALDFPQGLARKDRPIFNAALGCQATHLLTGDLRDFGRFMDRPDETLGVRIQTVAEFLDQLGQRSRVT